MVADALERTVPSSHARRFEWLVQRVDRWRRNGLRVVHCHGCFDLLHVGHVLHFRAARRLGDRLVVTITPDRFVEKGPERPVFPGEQRLLMVEELRVVDGAALNLWPSAVETIERLRPHVFAKGGDYRDREHCNPQIELEERALARTGGVLRYTGEISYSSTRLLQRLP